MLGYVPDNLKTQRMCKKAAEKDPRMIRHVPDHFKVGWCVPEDERKDTEKIV